MESLKKILPSSYQIGNNYFKNLLKLMTEYNYLSKKRRAPKQILRIVGFYLYILYFN